MTPILATLISSGLTLLSSAIQAKGKEVIESKLGISLDESVKSEDGLLRLKQLELTHEQYLLEASIKQSELELRAEAAAQGAVTERWKSDMLSDSWLSKNIRPLVLAFLTVCIVLLAALPITVDEAWIKLLENAFLLVLSAYFVGRTVEKYKDMSERSKL